MQVAFEVFKGVNAAPLLLLLLLSNQQLIGVQCLLILVRLGHLYLWQLTLIITHYYVLSHNQVTNWFEQVLWGLSFYKITTRHCRWCLCLLLLLLLLLLLFDTTWLARLTLASLLWLTSHSLASLPEYISVAILLLVDIISHSRSRKILIFLFHTIRSVFTLNCLLWSTSFIFHLLGELSKIVPSLYFSDNSWRLWLYYSLLLLLGLWAE